MRSLLDRVDLRRLRPLAAGGPPAVLAACLVDGGLLQADASDPEWPDRDRFTAAGAAFVAAVRARLAAHGHAPATVLTAAGTGGRALALALGAGVAARLEGSEWRCWCLLDDRACDDGRTWEAVRAAAQVSLETVTVLVAGAQTAPLWRASGWTVAVTAAAEPLAVLAAVDRALHAGGPGVVLAGDTAEGR